MRFPRRLIAERRIRFVHVGRHVRIPASAVAEFIEAGTVQPIKKWRPLLPAGLAASRACTRGLEISQSFRQAAADKGCVLWREAGESDDDPGSGLF